MGKFRVGETLGMLRIRFGNVNIRLVPEEMGRRFHFPYIMFSLYVHPEGNPFT